jgi:hypothetical protein
MVVGAFIFSALAFIVAIFQIGLAAGMPWGQLTWGGRFPGRLPAGMRIVAAVSALLMLAFALVVAVRAGLFMPEWRPISERLAWIVLAYCAAGVVANTLTPSRWERIVWLPVVTAMFLCALATAGS